MDVPSFLFLAFAAAAALVHGLFRARRWRMFVLLVTNIAFFLSFTRDPLQLTPYVGFLLIGYALIRLVGRNIGGLGHAVVISAILAGFVWLKRYSFIPGPLFLPFDYATVGLSYVFFRVLHLAITARDEPDAARIGPVQYVNYTLNFTALTAGPIQEYDAYRRMTEEEPASLTLEDVGVAIERIVAGLFKFSVMTTLVSFVQHDIVSALADPQLSIARRAGLIAALTAAYPIFLFLNFSGYTSFAIGIARFFRIELPENFDRPFSATSFIDYWSRWHMSLSNWLKAHVYNPILLNSARRLARPDLLPLLNAGALFVTFFLIGTWHGRTWHFVFFGLLNGGGVMVNQFYRIGMQRRIGTSRFFALSSGKGYKFVCRGITFAWVAFTLLWFWSDWPELGRFTAQLGPGGLALAVGLLIAGACVGIESLEVIRGLALRVTVGAQPLLASPYLRTVWITIMLLAVVAFDITLAADSGQVVYKEF